MTVSTSGEGLVLQQPVEVHNQASIPQNFFSDPCLDDSNEHFHLQGLAPKTAVSSVQLTWLTLTQLRRRLK
ncbi:hypothetical protein I3843_10G036100 [Carya illinoinensis]|nr:hypothetical protein I3843_10G036100 [Carya illinoinensis]